MSDAGGSAPLVTVVVPARNEQRAIEACLAAIVRQSVTNLEVLVVDGASEDATAKIVAAVAAKDDRVRCLFNAKRTIPRSLNIGLAAARGRWLVRVDAHSEVPDDYVATAVRLLEDGRWGGVGGRKDGHATSVAGQAIAGPAVIFVGLDWETGGLCRPETVIVHRRQNRPAQNRDCDDIIANAEALP